MPPQCQYCKVIRKSQSGKSFFKFPIDPKMRKKWCENLNLDETKLNKVPQLCSDHFLPKFIKGDGFRVLLTKAAYPSIQNNQMKDKIKPLMMTEGISFKQNETKKNYKQSIDTVNNEIHLLLTENQMDKTEKTKTTGKLVKPHLQNSKLHNSNKKKIKSKKFSDLYNMQRNDFISENSFKKYNKIWKLRRRQENQLRHKLRCKNKVVLELKNKVKKLTEEKLNIEKSPVLPPTLKSLIERYRLKMTTTCSPSKDVMDFSTSLYSLSHDAYKFVRNNLISTLPCPKTIIRRQTIDGDLSWMNKTASLPDDSTSYQYRDSNEETLRFIELYKRLPILWNDKHPQSKNQKEVKEAWLYLQQKFNPSTSIKDLKRRKLCLTNAYKTIKKKAMILNNEPSWFPFQALDNFLNEEGKVNPNNTINIITEDGVILKTLPEPKRDTVVFQFITDGVSDPINKHDFIYSVLTEDEINHVTSSNMIQMETI